MIKLHLDTDKQTVGVPMVFLRITDNNVDTLSVTVTSGGAPFDLTGYTVAFEGIGPKGNRIIDSSGKITNATSGKFSYTTAAALAQSQGHYQLAYFSLTKGSARTTTGNLNLFVYNSVPEGINPDDYIEPYNELIEKLNSAFTTATQNAQKKVADLETTTNDVTKRVTDNATSQIESVTNTAEDKNQEVSENAKKQVDSLNDQVDVLGKKIADYISGQTVVFEDFQSQFDTLSTQITAIANSAKTYTDDTVTYKALPSGQDLFQIVNNSNKPLYYRVNSKDSASQIRNSPVGTAFLLNVYPINGIRPATDNGVPSFAYTRLVLMPFASGDIWTASTSTNDNGVIDHTEWKKIASASDEVGGRNYILNAQQSYTHIANGTKGDPIHDWRLSEAYKSIKEGALMHISYDVTVTNSDSAPSYIGYIGKSWVGIVNALTYPNGTTHVSQSFIQPQDGSYGNMFLRITSDGSNATYTITNVMLEVGEVEHDCVPAPEDKADVSIRLKNGTNLNSVFNTGIYLLADATSIGNLPSGVSGSQWKTLVVIKLAAGNGTQILMDTNSTHTWIRGWNTNGGIVFTPWDQVAMASTVVKDNGDGTQTLNGKKFRPATYDELTQAISDLKVLIN